MVVILILFPLLLVIINSTIYHDRNAQTAFLAGLCLAIVFDMVVLISIPVRLHRLRTKLRESSRGKRR